MQHFTLRRGFAALMGFAVLALYVVWAAYGAAPTSLGFLTEAPEQPAGESAGAGGGHGGGGGMTPERFAELTEQFIETFSLPDGSVKPGRMPMTAKHDMPATEHADAPDIADSAEGNGHGDHGDTGHADAGHADEGHNATEAGGPESEAMSELGAHAVADADHDEAEAGRGEHAAEGPIDVYLMAMQFSYVPQVLRLEQGVPYRLRMMSTDVNHGASIHTGFAGHIMRRPAKTLVEMVMTFERPGEYMIYCTVYCGDGHDLMKGKIIVE